VEGKTMKIIKVFLVSLFFIFLLLACQSEQVETNKEGKCGDGVCDSAEQKNPDLCPSDCGGDQGGEKKCEEGQWKLEIEGCGIFAATEPSGESCTSISGCITVDQSCQIQGSTSGTHTKCQYISPWDTCSYDVECPDFNMSISGMVASGEGGQDIFNITIDPSAIVVSGTATCAGIEVPFSGGSLMQDAYGSAVRNAGGYFCEIEASQDSTVRVTIQGRDSLFPDNVSYRFNVSLSPGCD
jgi:hypothetical protein